MFSKAERRWAVWAGVIIMLITTIPYLAGFFQQTGKWQYTGLLIAAEDGNSYLAKMLLGANGDWLFRTPYSAYPQAGFLAFLPYLLLGKLTAPPGQYQQLVVLFHIFRIAGGILAVWATYRFISLFVDQIPLRRYAALLAVAGGGLGFLSLFGLGWMWKGPMGTLPLEFYSPETFGFLAYLALPHLVMGRALLLFGLVNYLAPNISSKWRSRISGGFLWFGLSFMQPLTVVIGWFILGWHLLIWAIWLRVKGRNGWAIWRDHLWRAFWMGLVSSPLVIYTFLSFQIDPFLKRWQSQNLIPSPPLTDYLLAFGLVLPLMIYAMARWIKDLDQKRLLVITWVAAFPILAYFPYNLQRRLLEGIWVAMAVLAVVGIEYLAGRIRKLGLAWTGIGFLPALVLLVGGLLSMRSPGFPLFRPTDEINAFSYLAQNAHKGDVVLASNDTANPLPAWAPLTVIDGHGPESLGIKDILPQVKAFYTGTTPDADRFGVIDAYGIRYVIWGPSEKALGDWNPHQASFLEPVYQNQTYQLFKVHLAGNQP